MVGRGRRRRDRRDERGLRNIGRGERGDLALQRHNLRAHRGHRAGDAGRRPSSHEGWSWGRPSGGGDERAHRRSRRQRHVPDRGPVLALAKGDSVHARSDGRHGGRGPCRGGRPEPRCREPCVEHPGVGIVSVEEHKDGVVVGVAALGSASEAEVDLRRLRALKGPGDVPADGVHARARGRPVWQAEPVGIPIHLRTDHVVAAGDVGVPAELGAPDARPRGLRIVASRGNLREWAIREEPARALAQDHADAPEDGAVLALHQRDCVEPVGEDHWAWEDPAGVTPGAHSEPHVCCAHSRRVPIQHHVVAVVSVVGNAGLSVHCELHCRGECVAVLALKHKGDVATDRVCSRGSTDSPVREAVAVCRRAGGAGVVRREQLGATRLVLQPHRTPASHLCNGPWEARARVGLGHSRCYRSKRKKEHRFRKWIHWKVRSKERRFCSALCSRVSLNAEAPYP
eukprot:m.307781 g.307781  ORF g.307781 m.307781 type:complete len:456 (-) comp16368_c0_seq3:101-1468(-)